jgi:hypothetical protein
MLREYGRKPVTEPGAGEIREARRIAARLIAFFNRVAKSSLLPFPAFRGCGWIDDCVGDVFAEGTLYEVKAGERRFRAIDLRQILIYSALNFAGGTLSIVNVCLINPRMGVVLHESLEELCQSVAGQSAAELLGEIVEYASEPSGPYPHG